MLKKIDGVLKLLIGIAEELLEGLSNPKTGGTGFQHFLRSLNGVR
jgi:hypothetical protein